MTSLKKGADNMQKCISITDEDLFLLREYREKNGLKSDSQAITSLIRQESEGREKSIARAVWEEFDRKYKKAGSRGRMTRNGNKN
ncbi:MAG: hypothetical protein NC293_02990 [Roseburia sp.]|nr:hypothetical protein [Roseburia sp.]